MRQVGQVSCVKKERQKGQELVGQVRHIKQKWQVRHKNN
jgi:hypothetical protein